MLYKFLIFTTVTFQVLSAQAFDLGPTTISDRLVQNLNCQKISVAEIYAKIRPEAYSVQTHIPEENWNSGLLGNCWSLAHAQRILFMLSRLDPAADLSDNKLRGVMDLLRGSTPEETPAFLNPATREISLRQYTVFSTDQNFSEGSQLYALLQKGLFEHWNRSELFRNFKKEIETFQIYRFYRPENLPMGVGDWERDRSDNLRSFQSLVKNINQHRLTLTNLRGERTVQHVVIPKRYEVASDGKYIFYVFDSNYPDRETAFAYDPKSQQFEGGSVMGAFYHTPYLTRAIGLFIVDEGEHKKIDEALVRYYTKSCSQNK